MFSSARKRLTKLNREDTIQVEVVMNNITLSVPGRGDDNISMSAASSELREYYRFLRRVEYQMYQDAPEWLIDLYGLLEEEYLRR